VHASHGPPPPDGATGLGKKVLVIPFVHQNPPCPDDPGPVACEWLVTGAPGPPRHTPAQWQAILNQQVNDYYLKATGGKTSFQFEVVANPNNGGGWFTALHNINEYVANGSNTEGFSLGQDAMAVADQYYDLTQWSRIVVMHNFQRRGAFKSSILYNGNWWPIVFLLEGATDQEMVALLSHEIAHTLGLPDMYGVYGIPLECSAFTPCGPSNVGPWDLMSEDPAFNHFSGYSKFEAGFLVSPDMIDRQLFNALPFSQNFLLRALAGTGQRLLRIRLTQSSSFYGYYVECRTQKAGLGDENVPEEGVLVTLIDEGGLSSSFCGRHGSIYAASNNPSDICDAALQPGETYFASFSGLSITNTGMDQDECTVEINWNGNTSSVDPAILEATQFDSPDIWVDSLVNGWNNYGPPTQTVDADGAPAGPGDPISAGQPHRVYYRVRNFGMSTAQNVEVEIGVRVSIETICGTGLGPMTVLATRTIPSLPPSASSPPHVDYVDWIPPTSESARLEVRVKGFPGEVTQGNNRARDSVQFYFPPCDDPGNCLVSAYGPALVARNDCPQIGDIRAVARFIPPGWDVMVTPTFGSIRPGEQIDFQVNLTPGPAGESIANGEPVEIPIEFLQTFGHRMTGEGGDTFEAMDGIRILSFFLPDAWITCASAPAAVEIGATVDTTGTVDPPLALSPVALEYTSPSGAQFLRVVTTDDTTGFSSPFAPDEEGTWSVRALWGAEETHRDATSVPCPFDACAAPQQPVDIFQVTLAPPRDLPVLHVADPNPAGAGTGYNVHRAAVAGLAQSDWTLLAVNAVDEDPATPDVQWTDVTGDISPTGVWYYQVAPYDGLCGAEGPW
jgi:M6 family metalloprotease-like protein